MLAHTGHVMTLANSIIGVGILAMPFCFQKCGILLSILLLVVSNWITCICCHYLIKSSLLTRRKSFEFLGFHAFGSSGKLLVELCIIGYLIGNCVTYFVVVGDLGPQILTKMFSLENITHLRTIFMFGVTLLCILPLGMLKNVDSLSAVCTASIGFYVCLVLKIILESETHILANDWADKVAYWRPAGVLQCLPIFSMALSCQMQLFEVFKSVNNQSVEKLNGIVRHATWICTCVYIAVGFFGYVAFCTQAFAGNILMNFSPSFGSDVIKIGFILSVAFSFPLVIFPCRASIYSLLYRKGHTELIGGGYIPEVRFKTITVFIVGFSLCVALMIPSVELVIGLVGSTIGVAICVMFPAACFRKIVKKHATERTYALSSIILMGGFVLMVLGTYANLQAIDESSSGAYLESNLKNNLPHPSLMPLLKEEISSFQNEKLEIVKLDKFLKNEDKPKLPQDEISKNENLSRDASVQIEKQPQIIRAKIVEPPPAQAPVLPVDEIHDTPDEAMRKKLSKINAGKLPMDSLPLLADKNIGMNVNSMLSNGQLPLPQPKILAATASTVADVVNMIPSNQTSHTLQQAIDKDAIKKDEEIAAEEQKDNKGNKAMQEELKKTQNELKQAKELFERRVDEIKEVLVKQNEKTQNLVVEKLDEVAEKFIKIERKVQEQDELKVTPTAKPKETEKSKQAALPNLPPNIPAEAQRRASLLGILSEPAVELKPIKTNQAQIYEPLSYKTGEIIEQVRNANKLEQHLPLPLALLINATQVKLNDIQIPEKPAHVVPPNDKLEQQPAQLDQLNVKAEAPLQEAVPDKPSNDGVSQNAMLASSKENVESIRRDILAVNTVYVASTVKPLQHPEPHERFKRSNEHEAVDFERMNTKLIKDFELKEPKLENLLQQGVNDVLDIKAQGIGRELKSLPKKSEDES